VRILSSILLIPTLVIFIFSCRNPEKRGEFSKQNDRLYYRLISFSDGTKRIKNGDYVFMKAIFKAHDSIFWDWKYNGDKNYFMHADQKLMNSALFGFIFNTYSESDSINLKVDKTLFFREVFDTIVPWFSETDTFVNLEIKIDRVLSEKEFSDYSENTEFRKEAARWQQADIIRRWVKINFRKAICADSLLFFEKNSATSDSAVRAGRAVTVAYRGSFLDGKIFDEIKELKPLTITYGAEGQMLRGIEKVIGRLRRGESAKIIIPSHLGFGEEGSSNGTVPPNTPVVYEIKILDVK
jgi:FKBP-type peptidyl-prolyl cis-trans isomerase